MANVLEVRRCPKTPQETFDKRVQDFGALVQPKSTEALVLAAVTWLDAWGMAEWVEWAGKELMPVQWLKLQEGAPAETVEVAKATEDEKTNDEVIADLVAQYEAGTIDGKTLQEKMDALEDVDELENDRDDDAAKGEGEAKKGDDNGAGGSEGEEGGESEAEVGKGLETATPQPSQPAGRKWKRRDKEAFAEGRLRLVVGSVGLLSNRFSFVKLTLCSATAAENAISAVLTATDNRSATSATRTRSRARGRGRVESLRRTRSRTREER